MTQSATSRAFWRDRSGATIVEFAIVAPVFFLLLLGVIQFGLVMFNRAVIEAVVVQVSRTAALGKASSSCDRVCTIKAAVSAKSFKLMNSDKITVTANPVASGGTRVPDICLTVDPPSAPAVCPPASGGGANYEDRNGIAGYQGEANMSVGEAGDIVEVRVSYPYKLLIPFVGKYIGDNGVMMISATTVVKNEPFGT